MQLIRSGQARDLRVDFFRGLALWWIFVDHIPGNLLSGYSLHNFAVSDASEIFVLLAGFAAAKAYAGAMNRHGWIYGAADAVKRAGTLYIAHLFLFLVYAAQVSFVALHLALGNHIDELGLAALGAAPYRALMEALTLRYQPNLLNILPLYVCLLVFFAAAMPLLRRPWLLLSGSFALYVAAHIGDWNMPSWRGSGWYFDPFDWQLLFAIGAALAYSPPKRIPAKPLLDACAVLVVASGFLVVFVAPKFPGLVAWVSPQLLKSLSGFDKTHLDPTRLASVMSFVWLATRLIAEKAQWLRSQPAAFLELLGQHSLPVFCSSILFGFVGQIALELNSGAVMQVVVNALGLAAMLGVGWVAAWLSGAARAQRPILNERVTAGLERAPVPVRAAVETQAAVDANLPDRRRAAA